MGLSRYRELARGQIVGDSYGMLKLLVSTEDLRLLGVHIFGTNATELVHIGQAVMGCGGTVEYPVDAVFNYPTFRGLQGGGVGCHEQDAGAEPISRALIRPCDGRLSGLAALSATQRLQQLVVGPTR